MNFKKIYYAVLLLVISCGGGGGGNNSSTDNGSNGGSGVPAVVIPSLIFFESCADIACTEKKLAQVNTEVAGSFSLIATSAYNSTSNGEGSLEYINGKVYFSANTIASANYQLWEYDPQADIADGVNPRELSSMAVGDINFQPEDFKAAGTILYFSAITAATGRELWQYDTSEDLSATNPSLVVDYEIGATGSSPNEMIYHASKLYYTAETSAHGIELRVYDPALPVDATNPAVAETFVGASPGFAKDLVLIGDKIYFSAWNGIDNGTTSNGIETWVFDTSVAISGSNPSLEVDFEGSALIAGSLPQHFAEAGGFIYFTASADGEGAKLRKYDPSIAVSPSNPSTIEIESAAGGAIDPPNLRNIHVVGTKLFFNVEDTAGDGDELWMFDTTLPASVTNPSQAFDLEAGGSDSAPDILGVYESKMAFVATTTAYGKEVWIYDSSLPTVIGTNPIVIDSILGGDSVGVNFIKNF